MMLLVDGNNMCFRALHTMHLSYKGKNTSVTYGMMSMLLSLLKEHKPSSVVVCFDGGTPPYRRRLLPEYKQNRKRSEEIDWEDAYRQIDELCYITLPMHGVLTLRKHLCEADDLMAQAAQMALDDVLLVTADDDLMQCVTKTVSFYHPTRQKIYTWDTLEIQAADIVLYKTLCGDSSDNVPGIPGVGVKTAEKVVRFLNSETILDYSYDSLCKLVDDMPLNARQKANFLLLGEEQWNAMYDVMDLQWDRVGARLTIAQAEWFSFDIEKVKRYYFLNGFISLVEANAIPIFRKLQRPMFRTKRLRTPSPMIERKP